MRPLFLVLHVKLPGDKKLPQLVAKTKTKRGSHFVDVLPLLGDKKLPQQVAKSKSKRGSQFVDVLPLLGLSL